MESSAGMETITGMIFFTITAVSFLVGLIFYRQRDDLPSWTRARYGLTWVAASAVFYTATVIADELIGYAAIDEYIAGDIAVMGLRVSLGLSQFLHNKTFIALIEDLLTILLFGYVIIQSTRGIVGMYCDTRSRLAKSRQPPPTSV